MTSAHMYTQQQRLRRWLVMGGLLLAALALGVVTLVASVQLHTLERSQAAVRAQMQADALAQRIEYALSVGIELERLYGVQAFFAQFMSETPGVSAVGLTDAQGRLLWTYPADLASNWQGLETAVSPVTQGVSLMAQVVLVRAPGDRKALMLPWAAPLLCALGCIAWLAVQALRYSWATGPGQRDALIRQVAAQIAIGDLTQRLPVLARHEFDSRPQWLAQQLRLTNEQQLRLQRLAQSLRQTEPDAQRRTQLDTIYKLAAGDERFALTAQARPERVALPEIEQAQVRWLGLHAGVFMGCLATAGWLVLSAAGAAQALWAWALLLALCLAAVLWAALRQPAHPGLLRRQARAGLRTALLGALLLGPTLALLLLLTFASSAWTALHAQALGVSAGVLWALLVWELWSEYRGESS